MNLKLARHLRKPFLYPFGGRYGTMDKVQVQDFIEDPEEAMPALHFQLSRPWSPERRQRCRT